MSDNVTDPNINRNEHVEENVQAKRTIPYGMNTTALTRMPSPLIDVAWDYVGFSEPDTNGNNQLAQFYNGGSGGTLVRTLTFTFDDNNNVATITRS